MAKRGRRARTLGQLARLLDKLNTQRQSVISEIRAAVEQLSFGSAAPLAGIPLTSRVAGKGRGGRRKGFKMSAEARAKIAAAQKRRWARQKAEKKG
jgi:hypothetical protein